MRRGASQRGYDARWRRVSREYLSRPFCAICARAGLTVPATVVDHVIPHKGNDWLFWDPTNWQSLCTHCHNSHKQSAERRGYSRAVDESGWPTDPLHPVNRAQRKK
jgi:5-methylcytosine-specific restriction enzyme A